MTTQELWRESLSFTWPELEKKAKRINLRHVSNKLRRPRKWDRIKEAKKWKQYQAELKNEVRDPRFILIHPDRVDIKDVRKLLNSNAD